MYKSITFWTAILVGLTACTPNQTKTNEPITTALTISRNQYAQQLEGFWLGQCIANWTGLVTEMDKIGNIGEIKTGDFYTRYNWGQPDQPNIWSEDGSPSELSTTIDFVLIPKDSIWGSDDDTDIEYIYQELLLQHQTTMLSPRQIADGWLKHIAPDEENYLWVSNQRAYELMQKGVLPPATSDPQNNKHYEMIDAQLTTEIFGLFAPGYPTYARKMAQLPISVSASGEAAAIANFYITMYALAAATQGPPSSSQLLEWAATAARELPHNGYSTAMYNYVLTGYQSGWSWEACRDSLYQRYQVEQADGYDITSRKMYCNGCFAAGINFGASLISLFYGGGDLKKTIKIGTLCGWDSDNPTATWGGMLGFLYGKAGVEREFGTNLSQRYNIHRTRRNFPNKGIDTFSAMARKGLSILEMVVEAGLTEEILLVE